MKGGGREMAKLTPCDTSVCGTESQSGIYVISELSPDWSVVSFFCFQFVGFVIRCIAL